ncbi:LysR family transcriptional regulator [Fructobacillus sp. M2-14]|uniref:LysR family transcriptional regulator n=1 Tax=Fructobacillus broussonetiae TaxID=2713173 RepID=A0ABS5R145_9LACO|nr:LysR family transcriptional regulator [Fructobacillus broussonetiae]MBS9339169.1 LysR family transcriptional regulator [Fructobacillus broussonetiae]
MRVQDLKYYLSLAELRNFSQVSKKFSVSQPTISLAMQRLEKEMKTELIWRDPGHKKIALTHSGRILAAHARVIVKESEQAEEEIQKEAEQKLVLGLSEVVDLAYFPAVQEHLSEHFFVHLKKKSISANDASSLLKEKKIDAALVAGDIQASSNLVVQKIKHPALQHSVGSSLPDFTLSFAYRKEEGNASEVGDTLTAILSELDQAVTAAESSDFSVISKTERMPKV